MKKICLLTTGIVALFLVVGSTNAFAGLSGIIAQGEFSVYKKGKLADKMSGITPVTEEALLVCKSNCLIKTKGISLIVQDGTEMAVKNGPDQFNLMIVNGLVDFSLTDQAGKVAFYTADGQYTVGDAMFNASTKNALRGYMQIADDGRARVGLHDGRMVFSTGEGPKTVNSNEYILLAQASIGASAAANASASGASAAASAAATASAGGASAAATASASAGWFGLGTGTIFTSCTVVAVATVTTVNKSKGSGRNPYKEPTYKGSSKGSKAKGSKKSFPSEPTVTKKGSKTSVTQTGTTVTTTKTTTSSKGSTKVTTKGSKGKSKGSKGVISSWVTTTGSTSVIQSRRPPLGSTGVILPRRPPLGSTGVIRPPRPWLPPPISRTCPTCPPRVVRPPCPTCPPPCCPPTPSLAL
jgi:hypothetical protein